jgi:hypothetical protein
MFTTITDLEETTLLGFADYHDMCGEFVLINKDQKQNQSSKNSLNL